MFWFLDTLVSLPVVRDAGGDGLSVIDSRARRGDSPPYHVHTTEDEIFHVVDGELVLLLEGRTARLAAGETLLAPKGVPHTYRVVSEEARWLAITARGDFERFVCEASRARDGAGFLPGRERRPRSSSRRSPSSHTATTSS